jgi:hypothetical protein
MKIKLTSPTTPVTWSGSSATSAAVRDGSIKARLIAEHGPDISLPELRLVLAGCQHRDAIRDPCGAVFPDLVK